MDEKKNNRKKIMMLVLVLGLVLSMVGTTYAFFTYTKQEEENILTTGRLYFVYDEKSDNPTNIINIQNALPMSDVNGKEQKGQGMFEFEVRATTQGAPIYYEIYLTKEANSTLSEKVVDTYLTSVGDADSETAIQNNWTNQDVNLYNKLWLSQVPPVLEKELNGKTLEQSEVSIDQENYEKTYRYRMWIDESANKIDNNGAWIYGNKTFTVKVNVYASNEPLPSPKDVYKDGSGANIPELADGMIPVVYDKEAQKWKKASVYEEWYDYTSQEWANAVTVVEDQRDTVNKAKVGTVIEEENINTMWVWIPRYEYDSVSIITAGTNKETPGAIDIKFLNGTSGSDGESYKLHPAFTFGEEELEGFWYAKFETSPETPCSSSSCNIDTIKPQIKPNVASWRNIQVATAFTVSQKMANEYKAEYGFSGVEDTHLSKNSEWGAVAYLSQSAYGKKGHDGTEVYINNCSSYTTGIAGDTSDASKDDVCANTYEKEAGQEASTTGNITGIYDMSGGAWEYMMGVLVDEEGKPRSGKDASYNSGFNGKLSDNSDYSEGISSPNEKYYDLYTTDDASTTCKDEVCYGQALSETSGWYNDQNFFIYSSSPWLIRGRYFEGDTGAGIFAYNHESGVNLDGLSFRLVLIP